MNRVWIFLLVLAAMAIRRWLERRAARPPSGPPQFAFDGELREADRARWPPSPMEAMRALREGDLTRVESWLQDCAAEPPPADGAPTRLREFLEWFPGSEDLDGPLRDLVERFPDSAPAALLRGHWLLSRARRARGFAWGDTVSEAAAAEIEAALDAAGRELERVDGPPAVRALALRDLVNVGGIGGDLELMRDAFRRAMDVDPDHFEVHLRFLNFLKPRWYGSNEEMFAFAEDAVARRPHAVHLRRLLFEAHLDRAMYGPGGTGPRDPDWLDRPDVATTLADVTERLRLAFPESAFVRRVLADCAYSLSEDELYETRSREAAELGESTSALDLGLLLDQRSRSRDEVHDRATFEEGLGWLLRSARGGNGEAMARIGRAFRMAGRSEEERARGIPWYEEGARRGSAFAHFELGQAYLDGAGVGEDVGQAMVWYRGGFELGNALCAYMLGAVHADPRLGRADPAEAAAWYLQAAKLGDVESQYQIGRILTEGRGVERDLETGSAWLRSAAGSGHEEASRLISGAVR